jgi:hypothetical protein
MTKYRPILSLAAAILVLFSSSSFMVGLHICGEAVQDVALFKRANVCEMEKKMPPCHRQEPKSCCDDEAIVHEAESFKVSSTETSIASIPVMEMVLPDVIISEIIPSSPELRFSLSDYDPPLRAEDITISFRVFLI